MMNFDKLLTGHLIGVSLKKTYVLVFQDSLLFVQKYNFNILVVYTLHSYNNLNIYNPVAVFTSSPIAIYNFLRSEYWDTIISKT